MPESDSPTPGETEIEHQLKKILSSPLFIKSEKPSEILTLVVGAAIHGKTLTGPDIRSSVFPHPPYDPKKGHHRPAINTLRKLLDEFYRLYPEDGIIIEMPVQKEDEFHSNKVPYPVLFRYNPRSEENTAYRLAMSLRASLSPHSLSQAWNQFDEILKKNPKHFSARVAWIECLCIYAIYFPNRLSIRETVEKAIGEAQALVDDNPNDHRAHAALANALLFAPEIDTEPSLNKARELAPADSWLTPWILFHYIDGAYPEDLRPDSELGTKWHQNFASYLTIHIENLNSWLTYGFLHYFQRDFQKAIKVFGNVIERGGNLWIAYLGLTLAFLALDNSEKAVHCYEKIHTVLEQDAFESTVFMSGIGFLAGYRAGKIKPDFVTRDYFKINREIEAKTAPKASMNYFESALFFLDIHPDLAVLSLDLARINRYPLTQILHVWPLFDPLREREDFKNLLRELDKLP